MKRISLERAACEERQSERGFAFWLEKGRLGDAEVKEVRW